MTDTQPTIGTAADLTHNVALGPSLLQAVAALLIVIGLIFLTAWLLRRFAFGGQLGRGLRQPKPGRNLAITESLWVDARHRIVTVGDTSDAARRYTVLIGPQGAVQLHAQQPLQAHENPTGSPYAAKPDTPPS